MATRGARPTKAVIIPGNGAGDIAESNWYTWVNYRLNQLKKFKSTARNMPDPIVARMSVWLPFMENELEVDENTIIIGHSSGAVAAVRYAEKHRVHGIVLVGAYHTDLGDFNEAESGYFKEPWNWDQAKKNTEWIVQYGSTDDPFLPWKEQEHVANSLDADLRKYDDRGHFMEADFPELVNLIRDHLKDWDE